MTSFGWVIYINVTPRQQKADAQIQPILKPQRTWRVISLIVLFCIRRMIFGLFIKLV